MSADLEVIFREAGFNVQRTKFEDIITEPELRNLIQNEFGKIELASILINYPHYFLMHKTADPEKGYLFAVVVGESGRLPKPVFLTLKSYFPPEIMLIKIDNQNKILFSAWFSDNPVWNRLGTFLKTELGIADLQGFRQFLKGIGWAA